MILRSCRRVQGLRAGPLPEQDFVAAGQVRPRGPRGARRPRPRLRLAQGAQGGRAGGAVGKRRVGGGVLARYGDLAALQVPLRGPAAARLQGHGRVQEALLGRRQPALLSGSSDEMPSVVERQIVLLHVW